MSTRWNGLGRRTQWHGRRQGTRKWGGGWQGGDGKEEDGEQKDGKEEDGKQEDGEEVDSMQEEGEQLGEEGAYQDQPNSVGKFKEILVLLSLTKILQILTVAI